MTSGSSVVETIRQQLAAGYSADRVVEGLMAGGLSRHSAERFIQRAGGHVTTVVPPPIPAFALATEPPPLPAPAYGAPAFDSPAAASVAPPAFPPSLPQEQAFAAPAIATAAPARPIHALKAAGGAALLLVGVGLLALALSASGRVRLKLPIALVIGGGVTLVQAFRER